MNNPNIVFRPVKESDLPGILEIARQTGPGFNSIPDNTEVMERKIARSLESFSGKVEAEKRFYLFVVENLENQEIVGTSAIKAYVGAPCPFYKFKLSTLVLVSTTLNQNKKHRVLHCVSEHEGATELEALYLKPSYRGSGLGKFLSRARCLFIAEFSSTFSELIIADMRGISDSNGISPFWEAIGRHFFGMSYKEASYLKATQGSRFVAELMPHYPIYIDLLPIEAQNVIGKTHENTTPAFQVLKKEGFRYRKCVDLFDGGPMLELPQQDLKTIKESKVASLVACKPKLNNSNLTLIANPQISFVAALGAVELGSDGSIILEEELAKKLNLSIKDRVRFCDFN